MSFVNKMVLLRLLVLVDVCRRNLLQVLHFDDFRLRDVLFVADLLAAVWREVVVDQLLLVAQWTYDALVLLVIGCCHWSALVEVLTGFWWKNWLLLAVQKNEVMLEVSELEHLSGHLMLHLEVRQLLDCREASASSSAFWRLACLFPLLVRPTGKLVEKGVVGWGDHRCVEARPVLDWR